MNIKDEYNRLGFIAPKLVEICDNLEETTACQRQFKYHLKRANIEAQKVITKHYNLYSEYGTVTQPDGTEINTEDVYNITAKAYDFLLSKKPHEISVIADIVKKLDADGVNYQNILLDYDPVLK